MGARKLYVVGRSGSGKSSVMYEMLAPAARLILVDYLPTGAVAARRLRLRHVRSLKEIKGTLRDDYARGFRLWYQPPIDHQVEALHLLSAFLWDAQSAIGDPHKGYPSIVLAVDELSGSFPNTALPANMRGFYRLSTAGRHVGISVVGASQRPAQVNTEFRGNLDAVYVLSLVLDADFAAVKAIGGKAAADFARTAPVHQWCRIAAGGALSRGKTRPI